VKKIVKTSRRKFIKNGFAVSVLGGLQAGSVAYAGAKKSTSRPFKMSLNSGIIGVKTNQFELLKYAIDFEYDAITPYISELKTMGFTLLEDLGKNMHEHGISWGSTNLPVEFREDEKTFKGGMTELAAAAKTLNNVGARRMNTWIMPTHSALSYRENFALHVKRLKKCAQIMGDEGVRLGLEYVAPKTLMARDKFSFIRSMKELRELISEINEANVGLVLDSFHWYCAGDTEADILALKSDDIITVDINDARSDLGRDEQIDNRRELPLSTGVINLSLFMNALAKIGYTGPVRSEPFNKDLNEMGQHKALKLNTAAMKAAFSLVRKEG